MKRSKTKQWVVTLMVLFMQFAMVTDVFGQSLDDARDSLEEQMGIIYDILQIIMAAALAVGLVGVVWAYAFNNQTAKDNLTGFIIAALIGAAGSAWLLAN